MADLLDGLCAALGAFDIRSPSLFSFAAEPIDVAVAANAPGWGTAGTPVDETERLTKAIQATFYVRCYARMPAAPGASVASDPGFVRRLGAANASRERWDKGWVIHQIAPTGQVFVRKGDRERMAMPGAFISEAMIGMAPQVGTPVSLRAPREALDVQPGYYFAFGETLEELADQLSLVRCYFHCHADAAVRLVEVLTARLNRYEVPFQLKAPATQALYGRADAAVLYVGRRYFAITARLVAGSAATVPLEPGVPLFTKPLWPGIGVAVDPGSGESFGTHRCRLAADGIVDAWRAGMQDVPARLAAVSARFETAGLELARPYLGPGGSDPFILPEPVRLR
jgi:hypothetical protein